MVPRRIGKPVEVQALGLNALCIGGCPFQARPLGEMPRAERRVTP